MGYEGFETALEAAMLAPLETAASHGTDTYIQKAKCDAELDSRYKREEVQCNRKDTNSGSTEGESPVVLNEGESLVVRDEGESPVVRNVQWLSVIAFISAT